MSINVHLEPEAQAFAKATANPPYLSDLGPEKGRAAVDEVQAVPISKPPVESEDRVSAGGPGGQVSVKILRPREAQAPLPVIVYLHMLNPLANTAAARGALALATAWLREGYSSRS